MINFSRVLVRPRVGWSSAPRTRVGAPVSAAGAAAARPLGPSSVRRNGLVRFRAWPATGKGRRFILTAGSGVFLALIERVIRLPFVEAAYNGFEMVKHRAHVRESFLLKH